MTMRANDDSVRSLDQLLSKCLHCGLCLPVCPTYTVTCDEKSSPRGRIRLIRSLYADEIDVSDEFIDEMNFCLDCQACETACPAGVSYAPLVEDARNIITRSGREPFMTKIVRKFILNGILGSTLGRKIFHATLALYQHTGLREAVEKSDILMLLPGTIRFRHNLLPYVQTESFNASTPEVLTPPGAVKGKIAFLTGCLMDTAFADIHEDCVEVLLRNGFEVHLPKHQGCCGSLHAHNGEPEKARELAEANTRIFSDEKFDAIVVNSAGCAAFMKEYRNLFPDDQETRRQAERVSATTREITEFLVERNFRKPEGVIRKRVTYHDACHLVHAQKISAQPREIVRSVPGIEFVELPESTWCCGSAGIYNILRYDDASKFLSRKIGNLEKTGAEIVLTANPGCHLQITHGLHNSENPCLVMHPVTLLNSSYKLEPGRINSHTTPPQ